MKPVTLNVRVNRDDAIRAGHRRYGAYDVEVDPSKLSEEQREELAQYGDSAPGETVAHPRPTITSWDMGAVKAILDWRIAVRQEREAEERENRQIAAAWLEQEMRRYIDTPVSERVVCDSRNGYQAQSVMAKRSRFLPDDSGKEQLVRIDEQAYALTPEALRAEYESAYDEAKAEAKRLGEIAQQERQEEKRRQKERQARQEALHAEAVRAILEQHATQNQLARWRDGLLPDQERRGIIRNVLFRPLDDFERYRKVTASDIPDAFWDQVDVDVDTADALPADAYDTLCLIRVAAEQIDGEVLLDPMAHTFTYESDDGSEEHRLTRYSAKVAVHVHNEWFSREYALPGGDV